VSGDISQGKSLSPGHRLMVDHFLTPLDQSKTRKRTRVWVLLEEVDREYSLGVWKIQTSQIGLIK
jgi:hypothetical protein